MSGADLLRMTSTVKAAMKIIKANGSLGPKALALGTAQAAKQAKGHAEDIVNAAVLGATYAALQTSGQAARAAQEAALAAGANEGDARSRAADAAAAAMIVEASPMRHASCHAPAVRGGWVTQALYLWAWCRLPPATSL